jgi:RND family efflux transporter MFP subunit
VRGRIALAAAILALAALISARAVQVVRAGRRPVERPAEATLVATARVARGEVAERISLTGTVRPRNEVEVLSKVAGRVESVRAQVGDRVRAGQILAVVEHQEIEWQAKAAQASLAVAEANYEGARLEWERNETLFEGGAISPAARDAARVKLALVEAQRAQARAAAGLAQQQLDNSQATSPISGTVTRRPVNVGAQVQTTTVLFAVQDVASLKLESSVDAAAFARLKQGAPAVVTIDSIPGEVFPGRVALLSPSLDPQTRRAAVEIAVDNTQGRLLPNMFAHVDVTVGRLEGAAVIPREAVLEAAGGPVVYRIRGGKAEAVRPRMGAGDEKSVTVLGGLAEGDEVAVSGLGGLTDGVAVRAVPSAAGAAARVEP